MRFYKIIVNTNLVFYCIYEVFIIIIKSYQLSIYIFHIYKT